MVYIYALVDPRDSMVFYVGQTATPRLRRLAHISESRVVTQYNGPKFWRINEILASGDEPQMVILETATPASATERDSLVSGVQGCGRTTNQ